MWQNSVSTYSAFLIDFVTFSLILFEVDRKDAYVSIISMSSDRAERGMKQLIHEILFVQNGELDFMCCVQLITYFVHVWQNEDKHKCE